MPRVLACMEERGISVDPGVGRSSPMTSARSRLPSSRKLTGSPGTQVNPGSPKRLGDILFGQMGLPGGTKTKTGQWSTGARAREELAEQGHQLPQAILNWRQVSKLRLDLYRGAARLRQSEDAPCSHELRARRYFHGAAIVVRTEPAKHPDPDGKTAARLLRFHRFARHEARLRRLFSDRVAAAVGSCRRAGAAQGPPGRNRYSHAMTASEMFGRPGQGHAGPGAPAGKSDQFRNYLRHFGVWTRSQLGIGCGRKLGAYIKKYFERFPGIRDYMDETREFLPRTRLCAHLVRTQVPLPGHQALSFDSAHSPPVRPSMPGCRAPRLTSSAAP